MTAFRTRLRIKGGFALLTYRGGLGGVDEAVPLYWIGPPSSSGAIAFAVPRTGSIREVDLHLPNGDYISVDPPVTHRAWNVARGDMIHVQRRKRWRVR